MTDLQINHVRTVFPANLDFILLDVASCILELGFIYSACNKMDKFGNNFVDVAQNCPEAGSG